MNADCCTMGCKRFHRAAIYANRDVEEFLLARRVDISAIGCHKITLSYVVAGGAISPMGWVTPQGRRTSDHMLYMGRLLEGGININAQDDRGRTALHHAVIAGSEVVIRLLLEYKLDLRAVSNSLGTPVEVVRANVSKGPE